MTEAEMLAYVELIAIALLRKRQHYQPFLHAKIRVFFF